MKTVHFRSVNIGRDVKVFKVQPANSPSAKHGRDTARDVETNKKPEVV